MSCVFIFLTFLKKFILILFFGCVGSSLLCAGLSLVVASGGYSSLRCAGFSLRWILIEVASLVAEHRL